MPSFPTRSTPDVEAGEDGVNERKAADLECVLATLPALKNLANLVLKDFGPAEVGAAEGFHGLDSDLRRRQSFSKSIYEGVLFNPIILSVLRRILR